MKFTLLLLFFLFAVEGLAGGITAPFSLNTTRVLPKGVRSLRVGAITTNVDNWHNSQGQVTGIAEPMVQELSYARLLKAENNEELKKNVEATLAAANIDLNTIAGVSLADINTRVTATVPALAIGITKRWTLAVAVPILYTNIDTETSFLGTEQLQTVVDGFAQRSRTQTGVIQQKLSDVIATELATKGYLPLEDRERTEVGDVSLISKYLVYDGLSVKWSITNQLTAPTARTRAINRLVDPAAGDGQWDFGATSILQIPITGKFSILHQVGHLIQFADHQDARVPFSINERLSADIDEEAYRDMGDISHTQLGFIYSPVSAFNFGAAYYAAYKQKDYWTGGLGSQQRYDILGVETGQYMQAAMVQLGASSVNAYQTGRFPIPMIANLSYSYVFDGRNVRNAPLWSFNATMFF